MTKRLLVVLLVVMAWLFSGVCQADDTAPVADDRIEVFRGLAWGDPMTLLEDQIEKATDELGVKAYIKKEENLKLGSVPLTSLVYEFFEEKLFRITLKFSHTYFQEMKEMLSIRYQAPKDNNVMLTRFDWEDGDTAITLNWPLLSTDYTSIVTFESKAAYRALQIWQETERAKQIQEGSLDW